MLLATEEMLILDSHSNVDRRVYHQDSTPRTAIKDKEHLLRRLEAYAKQVKCQLFPPQESYVHKQV